MMTQQICIRCKKKFNCNGSCGAKDFQLLYCTCIECWKRENEDKNETWRKEFIDHDYCQRRPAEYP